MLTHPNEIEALLHELLQNYQVETLSQAEKIIEEVLHDEKLIKGAQDHLLNCQVCRQYQRPWKEFPLGILSKMSGGEVQFQLEEDKFFQL